MEDFGHGLGSLGAPCRVPYGLLAPRREPVAIKDAHGLWLGRPHQGPQSRSEALFADEHVRIVVAAVVAPQRPVGRPRCDLDALALVIARISSGLETVSARQRDTDRRAPGQDLDHLDKALGAYQRPRDSAGHDQHPGWRRLISPGPASRADGSGGRREAGGRGHMPPRFEHRAQPFGLDMVEDFVNGEPAARSSLVQSKPLQGIGRHGDDRRCAPRHVAPERVLGCGQGRPHVERRQGPTRKGVGTRFGHPAVGVMQQRHDGANAERAGQQVDQRLLWNVTLLSVGDHHDAGRQVTRR